MRAIINMIVPEEPQYFEDFVCDDGVGKGSLEDVARLVGASLSTTERRWALARAWLRRALEEA